ncbi:putative F-box protein At5g55150 [Manihot esculenta]|uniref:KIB1-4 beta-propeller domain-containing protein n=1 Tax=Manihot esculenta TaxID=3983 RepID=A0A2C9WKW2_MANES|nr:putative F-box protein At5g55150 [Manihot esculenta]OAY59834.1 hypothetical protein MANES_01G063700v8 [Manihot esculenta]
MSDWSDLPADLLLQIAQKIYSFEDLFAFSLVSRACNEVALEENSKRSSNTAPWLILPEKNGTASESREFLSLYRGRVSRLLLPEAKGKQCLSSQGWLMIIEFQREISLVHPISHLKISLPQIIRSTDFFTDKISKFVLSSNPSSNSDFRVMAIYGGDKRLACCRPGDEEWTKIRTSSSPCTDLINYKGQFCVLDDEYRVLAVNFKGSNSAANVQLFSELTTPDFRTLWELRRRLLLMHWFQIGRWMRCYLVESEGALLIVMHVTYGSHIVRSDYRYKSCNFEIFKLDSSKKGLQAVNSLGNKALFLGEHSSSFLITAHRGSGYKPNCIYYAEDLSGEIEEIEDVGVYNLTDGCTEPLPKNAYVSRGSPALWVQPSF